MANKIYYTIYTGLWIYVNGSRDIYRLELVYSNNDKYAQSQPRNLYSVPILCGELVGFRGKTAEVSMASFVLICACAARFTTPSLTTCEPFNKHLLIKLFHASVDILTSLYVYKILLKGCDRFAFCDVTSCLLNVTSVSRLVYIKLPMIFVKV